MTARYDAEQVSTSPWAVRIGHDADELRRLANWLDILREEMPPVLTANAAANAVALDYFRLSARLLELSRDTNDFALSLTRVIP